MSPSEREILGRAHPDTTPLTLVSQSSYVDQLNQILHFLGTPDDAALRRVGSPRVSRSAWCRS